MLLSVVIASIASGCGTTPKQQEPISGTRQALNTSVSVAIYDSTDKSLLDGCFDIIGKYDKLLSRTDTGSEIYKLNETGEAVLSEDTLTLLKLGLDYSAKSEGAFDISIEPLSALWNFSSDNPKVPTAETIAKACSHVDYKKILLEGNHATLLDKDSGVDLGAIAKGYIADKVKEYLLSKGVKSALINLGGNVLCVGSKPDGSDFSVGLQDPFGKRNEYSDVVKLKDLSIVTSGTYERNFSEGGKTYHHLLNPFTGYPYDNGLVAVSIISKESVTGDALSTTCFALGLEKGMALIDATPDVHAVFIASDGAKHYSKDYPFKQN